MTNILHIDSSARVEGSVTRELTAHAVSILTKSNPAAEVTYHDLAASELPHIGLEFLGAMMTKTPTPDQIKVLEKSDALIAELEKTDVIVIGAPMYNFGVPTQLKAWIDHVARAGKTFSYTTNGPVGLLKNKRAIIAVGTGGVYSSGAMASYDHVVSYLRQVMGFIGITDVTIVTAEKQAFGAEVALGEAQIAHAALEQQLGA